MAKNSFVAEVTFNTGSYFNWLTFCFVSFLSSFLNVNYRDLKPVVFLVTLKNTS